MVAGFVAGDEFGKLGVRGDRFAVNLGDDVAFFQSGFIRGALGRYFHDEYACDVAVNPQFFFLVVVEAFGRHADAEVASSYGTVFHDVTDDFLHQIGRYGVRITGKGTGRGGDGGVDRDEFAIGIDECAAAAARVDCGIRLDKGLDGRGGLGIDADVPRFSADDTLCDGDVEVQGISDGEHPLTQLHVIGVADGHNGEVLRVDLDERQVGIRVGADDLGYIVVTVVKSDGDGCCAIDHMVVGDDITVAADDHARAGGSLIGYLHGVSVTVAEETPEQIAAAEVAEGIIGNGSAGNLVRPGSSLYMYYRGDGGRGGFFEIDGLYGRRIICSFQYGGVGRVQDAVVRDVPVRERL